MIVKRSFNYIISISSYYIIAKKASITTCACLKKLYSDIDIPYN